MRLLALLALVLAQTAIADIQPATRVTPYDWQCQDKDKKKISDHTRFDTAFVACFNSTTGAFLQGGTYAMPPKSGVTPPVSTGSLTVNWTPPTKHEDGHAVANGEIVGYRIFYGTNASSLTQYVDAQAWDTSKAITGLTKGATYYFAMTARTGSEESRRTNLLSEVVP